MAGVESREKRVAGATTNLKSLLFNFAWWLKKNGYAESTIQSQVKRLRTLTRRGADLYDPESVKDVIARQNWSSSTRLNAVHAYTNFLTYIKGEWNPPNYKRTFNLPFIPQERELDELIAGCSRTVSTFLQFLKETGARSGEAYNLSWDQIDFERGTVTITPEKGSNPRIFKISNRLLSMLAQLKRKNLKGSIFGYGSLCYLRRTFERQKKQLAYKLGNPRLERISFHTFRHWKATMLYHQTKDILYVMRFLGHKNIKNTLIYIQLEEALFKKDDEEYVCKAAKSLDEAKTLIELGFEYVCEVEGVKLFRRRK
ncbi:MAG: site-specific recombinase XerD [Candidatus Bathyarchaeota archaeon B26-2]|nr:MAG: site-specific recombinase XerD [Candidatus Bathyarchaeota archaeon B26-2]